MTGRLEDAARMYEWAREYDPTNHEVLGNLAAAYLWMSGENRKDKARELYTQAIELAQRELKRNPGGAYLLASMADYYAVVNPDTAVAYAERAIALEPENPDVLYKAATVYEFTDNPARALMLLGEAIRNGFSMKIVAHDPQLQDLREDSRYALLISEAKQTEN
jgi:serine/threonine-protein kinase